jgi:glycosyltransferase involved in cell wall biosynthesis
MNELFANPLRKIGVSVVMPVRNEERHLEAAVRAALAQVRSLPPEIPFEVVLAVGPSHDRTWEIAENLAAQDHRVKVVANPTGKTPSALNAGIKASSFDVIVRVDGHAELPEGYVNHALEVLARTGAVNVGGIMAAEGVTHFEKAVAAAMTSPLGVGASRFHTGGEEGSVDTVYLGVFDKGKLIEAGGYDERFIRAQDWELNLRLRERGGSIWFSPDLKVAYRPRSSLRTLAKQYFEYGRWRRVVIRKNRTTLNARYLAPPVALFGSLLGLISGFFYPWAFALPAGYLSFVLLASFAIAKSAANTSGGFRATLFLPVVLVTMQMAWGLGFLTSPASLVPHGAPPSWDDRQRE